ncbi:DUF58 domain-containing protein [Frigidibacter mobilis]|uniref:DUF58 domain-containing protein n=1 Tax=Frigidibacter mobilis TaxID=1335048 RepID=A0A159YZI6_9RHOB|nr:DUF58 domain-containing protein [Frigidibacter mobilis]AMY67955.1 hypothetical protein AKL17_0695 [Frigidibacter mobilis]
MLAPSLPAFDAATDLRAEDLLAIGARLGRPGRGAVQITRRAGVTATRLRGQGHEIREIRPYAEGDDLRHLDAAATARSGVLQVRSFQEDRDRSVMLIADFRPPMLWGTRGRFRSIAAAEALALAGWLAVLAGGSAGVAALTAGGLMAERPAARGRGMARVAGCLARAHAAALAAPGAPVPGLAQMLAGAARLAPRGAALVLATGFDDPGAGIEQVLADLLRRGPLRIVLTEDHFERNPPAGPLPYRLGTGPARLGDFTTLPAARADLVRRLARLGAQVDQLATDAPRTLEPAP